MQLNLYTCQLFCSVPEQLMVGLIKLSVGFGTDQRSLLAAQVISKQNHIDVRTHRPQPLFQVLQVNGSKFLGKLSNFVGVQTRCQ